MGFTFLIIALLGCGNPIDTSHLEKDWLHLDAKIPLPGVNGRIDHLAYDPAGHRLFVAALGNNTVEVVDLTTRTRIHTISGLHEPQGVLYIPALNRLVVANGGDGVCVFYDGLNYAALDQVPLGYDADNIRFDGSRVFVGYGSGGIAAIDPQSMQKTGDLLLKGHPESFQLGDSGQIWINVPDAGEIVAANLATQTVHREWKNRAASANFPMALDREHSRLFVAYRHPAEIRDLDSHTGTLHASIPCVSDADDIFFDSAAGLIFVSGGEGYLDVLRNDVLVNHIPTRKGARTSLLVPTERQLILAVPARGGEDAELWVYSIQAQ